MNACVRMRMYIETCMCTYVCVCACVRMCACVYVCMRMCMCTYVCVCACVRMCACVHVHVCMRMCIQTYACICIFSMRMYMQTSFLGADASEVVPSGSNPKTAKLSSALAFTLELSSSPLSATGVALAAAAAVSLVNIAKRD
jgi:hypothetical protein